MTTALTKAMELIQSNDPRALHQYLTYWRVHPEEGPTEYILAVIQHYNTLTNHGVRPDRSIGPLTLQYSNQRARWRDQDLNLTVTEFRVVRLLAENAGVFLTYRAIYDSVHYAGFIAGVGSQGYKVNVRSVIKRIRNKFKIIEPDWADIENYSSMGYRWRTAGLPLTDTPINGVLVIADEPAFNAR